MRKEFLSVLLVLAVAGAALAWDPPGDGKWETPLNWPGGMLPTITDNANLSWGTATGVTVTSTGVAKCAKLIMDYLDFPNPFIIFPGADVEVAGSVDLYQASGNSALIDVRGTLSMATGGSGTLKVGRASYGGTSTLKVSGTVNVCTGGTLGVGTTTAGGGAGATGYVNILDGGVVNAAAFAINTDALDGDYRVQLYGTGRLVIDGYQIGYVSSVIDNFYGDDIKGNVQATYDSGTGKTTVVVIPEPATIALLGLGGLLLRRKE